MSVTSASRHREAIRRRQGRRSRPWRIGRLAALGIEVGEVGIREQAAEPVTQDQVRVAGPERGASNPGGIVGHGRDRLLRLKRHKHSPS